MSSHKMKKYNIKSIREVKDGTLIVDNFGDEWLLREDNTLLHRDNRRSDNKFQMHFQLKVKSFYHCIGYIKSHSEKLTKPRKMNKMEYLFSII